MRTPISFDIVLSGGRVLDPHTGLDAERDIGISGREIVAVEAGTLTDATERIDVRGMAVAPGFIDLHSHASTIPGQRLQALDGVTTAMDLEAGAYPIDRAYRAAEEEGRPINYGFSTSWAGARMALKGRMTIDGWGRTILEHVSDPSWHGPSSETELNQILAALSTDLEHGAVGIGILLGYARGIELDEYLALARLAASVGCLTHTHPRTTTEEGAPVAAGNVGEIVRAAGETGASMHVCHLNSTSNRQIDQALQLIEKVRAEGSAVSTEAYPYGAAAGHLGMFSLDRMKGFYYARNREWIRDAARLDAVRQQEPDARGFAEIFSEEDPQDRQLLLRAVFSPDTAVASDALPFLSAGREPDPFEWPLEPSVMTHPRTAGTFSKAVRLLTRDGGGFSLLEAVRRCSTLPARLLEDWVPAMRRKGRVQSGCDADLVVFNPDVITDRATYEDSLRPSGGISHVLVNGVLVVRDQTLVLDALPGRAIRA